MLEVEIKALGPGPSFDVRDLPDNALPVLNRLFGVVAVLENSLAGLFFSVLGPRTCAQASMDSTTSLAFHGGTLALTAATCLCEAATPGPFRS